MTDFKERARRFAEGFVDSAYYYGKLTPEEVEAGLALMVEAKLLAVADEAEQREHDRHFDCEDDAKLLDCPLVKGAVADRDLPESILPEFRELVRAWRDDFMGSHTDAALVNEANARELEETIARLEK